MVWHRDDFCGDCASQLYLIHAVARIYNDAAVSVGILQPLVLTSQDVADIDEKIKLSGLRYARNQARSAASGSFGDSPRRSPQLPRGRNSWPRKRLLFIATLRQIRHFNAGGVALDTALPPAERRRSCWLGTLVVQGASELCAVTGSACSPVWWRRDCISRRSIAVNDHWFDVLPGTHNLARPDGQAIIELEECSKRAGRCW